MEGSSSCLSLLWPLRPVATNRWLHTSLLFIALKARAQNPGVGGATLSLAAPGPLSPSWSAAVPVVLDIPDCRPITPPPPHHVVFSLCVLFV